MMPSVILLGSKPAAAVALAVLLKRGWDVRKVVVARNVDHSWYGGPTIEDVAIANRIPVFRQAELQRDEQVDFVISYQFRNLVKADVLALARRAALNFHAAPLPEFGGWAFYNLAILEQVTVYGCSCHHMDEGFDTGPLVQVRRFPIDPRQETAHSLEARAQEEMIRLFADICRMAESEAALPRIEQDRLKMRYFNRQQMEALKEVPAGADAETIDRYARAFWYPPYQGAYVRLGHEKVEIVPSSVKHQLAQLLHAGDLDRLREAVGLAVLPHGGR